MKSISKLRLILSAICLLAGIAGNSFAAPGDYPPSNPMQRLAKEQKLLKEDIKKYINGFFQGEIDGHPDAKSAENISDLIRSYVSNAQRLGQERVLTAKELSSMTKEAINSVDSTEQEAAFDRLLSRANLLIMNVPRLEVIYQLYAAVSKSLTIDDETDVAFVEAATKDIERTRQLRERGIEKERDFTHELIVERVFQVAERGRIYNSVIACEYLRILNERIQELAQNNNDAGNLEHGDAGEESIGKPISIRSDDINRLFQRVEEVVSVIRGFSLIETGSRPYHHCVLAARASGQNEDVCQCFEEELNRQNNQVAWARIHSMGDEQLFNNINHPMGLTDNSTEISNNYDSAAGYWRGTYNFSMAQIRSVLSRIQQFANTARERTPEYGVHADCLTRLLCSLDPASK